MFSYLILVFDQLSFRKKLSISSMKQDSARKGGGFTPIVCDSKPV